MTGGGTMPGDDWEILDPRRTVGLGDVGSPDHLAATVVSADGAAHLVLARRDALNDPNVRCDATCSDTPHEQLGQLPLEFVKRITITRRNRR